jgi:hypothetical protein
LHIRQGMAGTRQTEDIIGESIERRGELPKEW